jgi:F-type H+-transporting ATPase subunit epsilon
VQLKILVPAGIFASIAGVERIVAMTPSGSFGLLPQRLDCAAVLAPGLLTYSAANLGEVHIAIDAGVLLKTGAQVLVCVRHAIAGADLGRLREAVEQEILKLSAQESASRKTLAQLESGLIREFVKLQRA